ncbi:hypothetical protein [Conchiformibius steedae]|uniref:hypothetical protein n=1 Tax=Conchiformibius steedae TaxID=153493 RepID=UPI0026F11DC1|nr:hypothetical protein [Conchiformibius steedae]
MFDFVHQNAVTFENRDTFLRSQTDYFPKNLFILIHPNEIDELQKIIPIPKQLKRFWLEVGGRIYPLQQQRFKPIRMQQSNPIPFSS